MNTISSRNIDSFKNHLLQYMNINNTYECCELIRLPYRDCIELSFKKYSETRKCVVYTSDRLYKEVRKTSNVILKKSEYNTDIINLLSLYNHYAIMYNIVKPKYLLITCSDLSGIKSTQIDIQRMFILSNNMFKHITDYYCNNSTYDPCVIIEL